jgi:hypothetical protein
VEDITTLDAGIHTVNSSGELIYIDINDRINKLSVHDKNVATLIHHTSSWKPQCVYCSSTTGNLMVGMRYGNIGKVVLYNSNGKHVLTIQHDNNSQMLYSNPLYIRENKNGDIIVSDWVCRAVVVTDRVGKHRFFYTGPPPLSKLQPLGICTDALSPILVCDYHTNGVQMIDKDGHFLSVLLRPYQPYGLEYDDKTHLLSVGQLETNTLRVYRYVHRKSSLNGRYH